MLRQQVCLDVGMATYKNKEDFRTNTRLCMQLMQVKSGRQRHGIGIYPWGHFVKLLQAGHIALRQLDDLRRELRESGDVNTERLVTGTGQHLVQHRQFAGRLVDGCADMTVCNSDRSLAPGYLQIYEYSIVLLNNEAGLQ